MMRGMLLLAELRRCRSRSRYNVPASPALADMIQGREFASDMKRLVISRFYCSNQADMLRH
ncbi:hypothetical protein D3C78_1707140 [compost metagenome]